MPQHANKAYYDAQGIEHIGLDDIVLQYMDIDLKHIFEII